MRQLPIVIIDGKMYYRDDRLLEFRAVDNPHDRICYEDFEPEWILLVLRCRT